jgi:hypothetical protein
MVRCEMRATSAVPPSSAMILIAVFSLAIRAR